MKNKLRNENKLSMNILYSERATPGIYLLFFGGNHGQDVQ